MKQFGLSDRCGEKKCERSAKHRLPHAIRGSLIAAYMLTLPFGASAELQIKRDVMTDCPTAIREVPALTADERRELIEYLRRVLALEGPQLAEAMSGTSRMFPDNSPLDLNVFSSLQPTRDLQAKRCSIQLLQILAPTSFTALPELLKLLSDARWTDDFVHQLSETAMLITIAATNDAAYVVPEETVRSVIEHLSDHSKFYAIRSLIELGPKGSSLIIGSLRRSDIALRGPLFSVLRAIDPEGESLQQPITSLLFSADEELRTRIIAFLNDLPALSRESIVNLLHLNEDAPPRTQVQILRLLTRALTSQNLELRRTLTPEETLRIVTLMENSTGEVRDAARDTLIASVPLPDTTREKLEGLAEDGETSIRTAALTVALAPPTLEKRALELALQSVFDSDIDRQIIALNALAKAGESAYPQIGTALARLLKSVAASRDRTLREKLVAASITALGSQKPTKLSYRWFLPYALEAISAQSLTVDQEALLGIVFQRIGTDATSPLLKILQSADALSRVRALRALAAFPNFTTPMIDGFVSHLDDPDRGAQQIAIGALSRLGDRLSPIVEREYKKMTPLAKVGAAEVVKSQNADLFLQLQAEVIKDLPCSEGVRVAPLVHSGSPAEKEQFIGALLGCRERAALTLEAVGQALRPLGQIPPGSVASILGLLGDERIPFGTRLSFLSSMAKIEIPHDQLAQSALALLIASPEAARERVVEVLPTIHAGDENLVQMLTKLFEEGEDNPVLQHKIIVVLAQLNPQALDIGKFYVEEFEKDHREWIVQSLSQLPNEIASNVIIIALDRLSEKRKRTVIAVTAGLKALHEDALQKVAEFLTSGNRETRFLATYTLLRLQPGNPQLLETLRAFLIEPEGAKIDGHTLPFAAEAILLKIVAEPKSAFETGAAKRILRELHETSAT